MRRRPKLLCITSFFALCTVTAFIYYLILVRTVENESSSTLYLPPGKLKQEIHGRLAALESELRENQQLLKNVRVKVNQVSKNVYEGAFRPKSSSSDGKCTKTSGFSDYSTRDMYDEIKFDNPDGGAWKQGWNIELNASRIGRGAQKLRVFVVPHSHNDPGWIKTFEQYFRGQTRHILNNMLKYLPSNPSMKFIWAETSYFAFWWDTLTSDSDKDAVRHLLKNGQLEIVNGGWVMNDNANCHYSAIISQMVEGHEWLAHHLDFKPKYGWEIDPFGHSPSMAFLFKKMKMKGMVIQRIHYSFKKYLAQHQLLEYKWRQFWESDDNPDGDIICHTMPFYSYDVPHTCGPDPKVCCQFDFRRMAPFKINCPWKIHPQKITESNVKMRAELLLEQYRKKAMLYRTNNLLVPLGDDFRYEKVQEWENQHHNFKQLFDYMNSNDDYNVEVKFGTLSDYFESLESSGHKFPSLTGDFFTYADRDDHYWSGYYTSRPFYKRFDRILESHLRAFEILYSISCMRHKELLDDPELKDDLEYIRQNLALFQHHDAITGTAREIVVADYAQRMFKSLVASQKGMSRLTETLMAFSNVEATTGDDVTGPIGNQRIQFIEIFPDEHSVSHKRLIQLKDNIRWSLVAYNSLARDRNEVLCFHISFNDSNWILKDESGKILDVQLNYLWDDLQLSTERIEACFRAKLPPVSLSLYSIEVNNDINAMSYGVGTVKLYNFDSYYISNNQLISKEDDTPSEIQIESENVRLVFSGADGMLRRMIQMDRGLYIKSHEIRQQFMSYGTKTGRNSKSGAYLFIPDTPEAQSINYNKPKIRVTNGQLISRVEVIIERPIRIRHEISLKNGSRHFDMRTEFNLVKGSFSNRELLLRFYTEVQNGNVFYTDLNGLQMTRREKYDKIPLQGNVYPVPTMMYIEDESTRLSLLSGQPLGGLSPHPSFMDIFLDRKLLQDDQRGLGQGLTDNRRTKLDFKVIFEPKPHEPLKPSQDVQNELLTLLNPVYLMDTSQDNSRSGNDLLSSSLPCDYHLLNLRRSFVTDVIHLTIHRLGVSCETACDNQNGNISSHINLRKLFGQKTLAEMETLVSKHSLSYLYEEQSDISISDDLKIQEMDLSVYGLKRKK